MHESAILNPIVIVVGLVFIAAVAAIVLRQLRFPYTIGLVLIGILLGFLAAHVESLEGLRQVQLSPEIILFLILPTLLFEAAINIHVNVLYRNLLPILLLATVGLLLSTAIIGLLLGGLSPIPLGIALLFGALISATDPVAVIALFKEIGVPDRLSTLVDGESLFNDATAIVVFNIILGIIVAGHVSASVILSSGAIHFVLVFLGGLVVGIGLGAVAMWILAWEQKGAVDKNDHLVQIAISTVLAYVAFILADHVLHVSGVMAVVGAGIYTASKSKNVFDENMQNYIREFWEYAAFVANSLIFLLIGLTEYHLFEDLGHYRENIFYILLAIVVSLLARAAVIYGLTPLSNLLSKSEPISTPYQTVMFWGGLKGAVPLALVLGLPQEFEHRVLLLDMTLGVVLFSLLVQGTTVSKLLNHLKIAR